MTKASSQWWELLRTERGIMVGVTASVFMLGLLMAGMICYMTPRVYEVHSVFEPLTLPGVTVGATDPETVCSIMTSKECVSEVCGRQDLVSRMKTDRDNIWKALGECATVGVQPNGKLVEVTVRMNDPYLARDVAAELPRTWGRRALKLGEKQYTETITRAEYAAENHEWNVREAAAALTTARERSPRNPEELATLQARLEKEGNLAAALREEALRLTAVRGSLVIPMVVHQNPVAPGTALAPDVGALFNRWIIGSLAVGLALALPAAVLSRRLKGQARPAEEPPSLVAEGNW